MPENPSINIENEESLNEIVNRAKRGDEVALEQMCRYLYKKLYSYVFYRVRHYEDAEEVTGEVVLKIVKNLKKQKGNFYAWIYKIAGNAVIDYFRRFNKKAETSYEDLRQERASEEKPKELLNIDRLKQGLAQLTKDQADVITLKYMQEYSNEEVARIMKRSVGAIKVLHYRAVRSLREYFKRMGYEIKD